MLTFKRFSVRSLKKVRGFTSSNVLLKDDKTNEIQRQETDNAKGKKDTKEEVNTKLNDLLKLMVKNEKEPIRDVKVPQAVKHEKVKPPKEKPLGEKLADAAKDVAKTLGGDVQKTESELLNILLKRAEPSTQELKDVLSGMKVEKASAERDSRAKRVRDTLSSEPSSTSFSSQLRMEKYKTKRKFDKSAAPVDILGAKPSSYFDGLKPEPVPVNLSTWESCVQRDLRLGCTHPPTNIYEQMIQWTDRGMLWRFPIDNEQGLDEEKQVSFEEHIFLEAHLEGWCPERGPIRHFMELVCVGLSKNHWLTAEEKRTHIYWYRDYFADKGELLQEIGAGTVTVQPKDQGEISQ